MKKNNYIKNIFFMSLFLISIFILGCSASVSQSNIGSGGNEGYNQAELNNYGEWIQTNDYGNVWRPYVVSDWMPFDNGHWAYADGNWTWISYEPFGWIVYHYGNWYDDPYYGWVWIPSNDDWSPARVTWIDYDDYVGWAPLPPAGLNYGNPWDTNENRHWHVVKQRDFTLDNVRNYRVINPVRNESGSRAVIRRSPNKSDLERSRGTTIPEVRIPRETVQSLVREIKKMNLPPQETKRVRENSPRVKNEVLVPRNDFQKQEAERKKPPKRETNKR